MLHQKQWQFLKRLVEQGKIPHAFLFSGPKGIGKKALALRWLSLLLREDLQKKYHPDLLMIEPKDEEISISQIRDLTWKMSFKPHSALLKAALINRAHCLNQEAQSAFLKLLEEPKGQTLFILISEYPERLLPTILSRTERLKFYPSASKFQPDDYQKKIINKLKQLQNQNLALRFQYAKELSEKDPEELHDILETWLRYFREVLLSQPENLPKLKKTINTLQTVNLLLSTTNINSRLALETLMLEL